MGVFTNNTASVKISVHNCIISVTTYSLDYYNTLLDYLHNSDEFIINDTSTYSIGGYIRFISLDKKRNKNVII